MRDELGLFFGLVFLIADAALLYNGLSGTDASQPATIMAGATLLPLGSIVMWNVLRKWWVWRKEYRRYRNG